MVTLIAKLRELATLWPEEGKGNLKRESELLLYEVQLKSLELILLKQRLLL